MPVQDIRGQKFGRLTPLECVSTAGGNTRWKCRCDCGNIVVVNRRDMRPDKTQSCGCMQKERTRAALHKEPKYRIDGNTAICETNSGVEFYVDVEDLDTVLCRSWYISNRGYVASSKTHGGVVYLHKLLVNAKDNEIVDHIDRNKLNNRKENLRACTLRENRFNKSKRSDNTSGFTGVAWNQRAKMWQSYIAKDHKMIHLGSYKSYADAVWARYNAEVKHFGTYAPHTYQDATEAIKEYERRTE